MSSDQYSERFRQMVKGRQDRVLNNIDNNPCFNESKLSLKCSTEGGDDCEKYFDNFRRCKKFWGRVVAERRKKKIEPHLPIPSEREQALEGL